MAYTVSIDTLEDVELQVFEIDLSAELVSLLMPPCAAECEDEE